MFDGPVPLVDTAHESQHAQQAPIDVVAKVAHEPG